MNPQFHEQYNGEAIVLNEEQQVVLDPKDFPNLKNYIGQTLITTDGTTLLGADDKAGIAEIMTAMEILINDDSIEHGDIRVGFGPDEELVSEQIVLMFLDSMRNLLTPWMAVQLAN